MARNMYCGCQGAKHEARVAQRTRRPTTDREIESSNLSRSIVKIESLRLLTMNHKDEDSRFNVRKDKAQSYAKESIGIAKDALKKTGTKTRGPGSGKDGKGFGATN